MRVSVHDQFFAESRDVVAEGDQAVRFLLLVDGPALLRALTGLSPLDAPKGLRLPLHLQRSTVEWVRALGRC